MNKRVVVALTSIVLGFWLYLIFTNLVSQNKFIPAEFSQARVKGAVLASTIVDLSSESLGNLSEIAKYDRDGNRSEALILISKEVIRNRESHEEAIKLSAQLEKMARSLSQIEPTQARILATEAVSSEVALVSRLISYNDYLLQLFEALRNKLQSPANDANGSVDELVAKINEEARAINDFNRRFTQSLAEFDKIFLPE